MSSQKKRQHLHITEIFFNFNVMHFVLATASAIFQELMSRVLEGLGKFTVAYIDDILIFQVKEAIDSYPKCSYRHRAYTG